MSNTNRTKNTNEIITGYKAFDPDFTCRGYQYKVGKTFKHNGKIGRMYSEGFHFCHKDPFNVFEYYPLVHRKHGLPTRFAKVSAPKKDTFVDSDADDRCVTSKISIDEEITLDDLINEQIEKAYKSEDKGGLLIAEETWVMLTGNRPHTKIISNKDRAHVVLSGSYSMALVSADSAHLTSSGYSAGLFATGYYASVSASGSHTKTYSNGHYSSTSSSGRNAELRIMGDDASVASSGGASTLNVEGKNVSVSSSGDTSTLNVTGKNASVSSSGLSAELTVKGDFVATASSGEDAELRIMGDHTSVASGGAFSKLSITGDDARVASVGAYSRVAYEGKGGVITVLGVGVKFKGSEGTLVSAVVYDKESKPIDIITGRIGENGLKPDTLYTVRDGKFVEVGAGNE